MGARVRQVPNFVLNAALSELEQAREWLRTIHAPEKKEIRDNTPVAVAYWIDRADEKVREVMAGLERFDVDVEDDWTSPQAFRDEPSHEGPMGRSDVQPRPDGDLVPPA